MRSVALVSVYLALSKKSIFNGEAAMKCCHSVRIYTCGHEEGNALVVYVITGFPWKFVWLFIDIKGGQKEVGQERTLYLESTEWMNATCEARIIKTLCQCI